MHLKALRHKDVLLVLETRSTMATTTTNNITTSPATYPLMSVVNDNDEELIIYIPLAVIRRDDDVYPFVIVHNNLDGYILAVMDEAVLLLESEGMAQKDVGFAYTRRQVLNMYFTTAKSLLLCNSGSGRFLMDLADPYVEKMLEDEAKASGNPIQYVKSFATQTRYPLVHNYLDRLLEEYANKQFLCRKAHIIQKYFRRVISDPYHDMCKRRLLYEFHDLTSCTSRAY